MGDRTYFQAWIYACPEDQQAEALDVLAAYFASAAEADSLTTDERYTEDEVSVGSSDECAASLIKAAPGCSFVLLEDPKYEWLGSVNAYTPSLGHFSAECDSNGEPVYTRGEILGMVRQATEEGADLPAFLSLHTGQPWFDDWHAKTGGK